LPNFGRTRPSCLSVLKTLNPMLKYASALLLPPFHIELVAYWFRVPDLGDKKSKIAVNQSQRASTGAGKIPDRKCQFGAYLRATSAG
jgi:hypothetical protein